MTKRFLNGFRTRRAALFQLAGLAFAAAVAFQIVLDWRILPFSSIDWALAYSADTSHYYLAFAYYRYAGWHLPITHIDTLLHPVGASIALTDGIPLVAIPAKALSWALPENFQYFGLWLFACIFLNGYFAKRFLDGLMTRPVLAWCGAVLVMFAPPLVNRFAHCALSAHFVILWAFCLVIERERIPRGEVWLLSALSLFIHPYLAAMANALLLGVLWVHRRRPRALASLGAGWAASFVGSAWLLGYFGVKSSGGLQRPEYLADLTALFSSRGSSSVVPEIPGLQKYWEGHAYLGLGGILLLCALIANALRTRFVSEGKRSSESVAPVLALLSLALACFAVSPSPSFLGERHAGIPALTALLYPISATFRAGGRFIWPLFYFIVLFGTHALDALVERLRFPAAGGVAAFTVLLAQASDLGPWFLQSGKNEALIKPPPAPQVSEAVRAKVTPSTRFMIFDPPVQRTPCRGKRSWRRQYLPLALFAAQKRLTVNTDFQASARLAREDLDAVCRFASRAAPQAKADPSIVVVHRGD